MPLPTISDRDFFGESDTGTVEGYTVYESVEKLKRHDDLILIDKGDKPANDFLREHGYGADGNPLKRKPKREEVA